MRHIRAIGLGAFVALALAAFPAGAAASGGLEADSYPTVLTGGNTGSHAFSTGGGTNSCGGASLGESVLLGQSGTVAMSPSWVSCTSAFQANGCKFELHAGTENSFDIGPNGCGPMTTQIGTCKVFIGSQTGLPATYANTGAGTSASVTISSVANGITYTQEGVSCSKGPLKDGQYAGTWSLKGKTPGGAAVGIRATDGFNGFFVANKQFEAEKYPIAVSGPQDVAEPFTLSMLGSWTITCTTAQFSAELTKATNSLGVGATFAGCTHSGEEVTIAMNSCYFAHGVTGTLNPETSFGTLGIGCAKEGDFIEVNDPGFCVAKFAAQKPSGSSALYTTAGSGNNRYVTTRSNTSANLAYTTESICSLSGKNRTDGKISMKFSLRGP